MPSCAGVRFCHAGDGVEASAATCYPPPRGPVGEANGAVMIAVRRAARPEDMGRATQVSLSPGVVHGPQSRCGDRSPGLERR